MRKKFAAATRLAPLRYSRSRGQLCLSPDVLDGGPEREARRDMARRARRGTRCGARTAPHSPAITASGESEGTTACQSSGRAVTICRCFQLTVPLRARPRSRRWLLFSASAAPQRATSTSPNQRRRAHRRERIRSRPPPRARHRRACSRNRPHLPPHRTAPRQGLRRAFPRRTRSLLRSAPLPGPHRTMKCANNSRSSRRSNGANRSRL
jgi:hypothetical protein